MQAARELGLGPESCNPFMNTIAQIVECAHEIEEARAIVGRLLETGLVEEDPLIPVRAGRGVGAVEAPRGLLIHDYTYDDTGRIAHANLVIPTNQNNGSIQEDLEAVVRESGGMDGRGPEAPLRNAHQVLRPLHRLRHTLKAKTR